MFTDRAASICIKNLSSIVRERVGIGGGSSGGSGKWPSAIGIDWSTATWLSHNSDIAANNRNIHTIIRRFEFTWEDAVCCGEDFSYSQQSVLNGLQNYGKNSRTV